jgi:formate--tetrahydrofolate ligase
MQTDLEIAKAATPVPIEGVAAKLGIAADALTRFGQDKAKLTPAFLESLNGTTDGRLILVTGITPTPAGEGKTTTTIGLADALNRLDKRTAICIREPSLGPCFGMKGGAAGGGYSQVIPMEDINLHFTGDMHAIGAANNLLAALVDNHIHWSNDLGFDLRRPIFKRVVDMNDRALRQIVCSLGGPGNGFPRQDGFDITVASEVMAIFCLATSLEDLKSRLGRIIVGFTRSQEPITARQVGAEGAMTALLKDAFMPNLVQTLENNPAFVHGGPFANIAHGCNSVMATRTALKLADYVVTEAGFGSDLGAEKFFDIKCRKAGLAPSACVIVATVRAIKMNGGAAREDLENEDLTALEKGLQNLERHIRIVGQFGVPAVVGLNRFSADSEGEINAVLEFCAGLGASAVLSTHWADGGEGAEALAQEVIRLAESGVSQFRTLYTDDLPLWDKARTIARSVYGAEDIIADKKIREQFRRFDAEGYGHFPICMAKTQYSFSTDPNLRGAPTGHVVPIREVRLAGGAEFLVALCGELLTMPGLPRVPAANQIDVSASGEIEGLF